MVLSNRLMRFISREVLPGTRKAGNINVGTKALGGQFDPFLINKFFTIVLGANERISSCVFPLKANYKKRYTQLQNYVRMI